MATNDQSFNGWGDLTKEHNQDPSAEKSSEFVKKMVFQQPIGSLFWHFFAFEFLVCMLEIRDC